MSCYTCMGRDDDNCMHGLTCCKGSCFKLVDEGERNCEPLLEKSGGGEKSADQKRAGGVGFSEHQMIVKGCTNDDEEDASMKVRTLNMALYWVNNEKVKGEHGQVKFQSKMGIFKRIF